MRGPEAGSERLFLAVPLSQQARQEIMARLPVLPGRLVPPQNWHFTLRFLGDTEAATRDRLIAGLRTAALGPSFSVSFGRIGAFPRSNRARIVWLGVDEGAEHLVSLAKRIERAVRRAGLPAEKRPFKPHLTLSRIEPMRSVADLLGSVSQLKVKMPVTAVALVQSQLGKGPAQYQAIEHFDLAD